MRRVIRRLLGMGPTTAELHRAAPESLGRERGYAEGLRGSRPLTAEEMTNVAVYSGRVARRAFPALYSDEG
jgi:hypothetical protein